MGRQENWRAQATMPRTVHDCTVYLEIRHDVQLNTHRHSPAKCRPEKTSQLPPLAYGSRILSSAGSCKGVSWKAWLA